MLPGDFALGLKTLLGNTLSLYDYYRKNIRNYRWSFGFQHELFRDMQIELNYVGQRAANLITATSSGDSGRLINAGWNGTGGTYDQNFYSLGSRLNATRYMSSTCLSGLAPAIFHTRSAR